MNYGDLLYFGWTDLFNRAVRAREGISAVNQSLNLGILKSQKVLNRDNLYLNHNMDEVRTTTIQHINDAALYYHYGEGVWIDSPLLLPPADPNAPVETVIVEFGTPEFMKLANRLALQGRQGCLCMSQDVTLWESGNMVNVRMPRPVTIPAWSESIWPRQTITPGKGLTAAEEFSVLAHETAHEIMHKEKDNMPKDKKVRETEAEAVAFVVCHGIGLGTNSASSDYIQLYNGDKETLMESLERIQKTASEILEAVMDKESGGDTVGKEKCMAVAAKAYQTGATERRCQGIDTVH